MLTLLYLIISENSNPALYDGNIYSVVFHFLFLMPGEEIKKKYLPSLFNRRLSIQENKKMYSPFSVINIWNYSNFRQPVMFSEVTSFPGISFNTYISLPAFGAYSFHTVYSHSKQENTIFNTVKPSDMIL